MTEKKKLAKRQKPEDFIGETFNNGKLIVVGIADKTGRDGRKLFKVVCTECSKDRELFPDGYFISHKSSLVKGSLPCGCALNPKWKDWQYPILARRSAKGRFIVHGFAEEFRGKNTKLSLECLKDGHKWTASIDSVINAGHGCPKCKVVTLSEQRKTPEHLALQKCIDICKEMSYVAVGFVAGYKNQNSRFEYTCKIHGEQEVRYNDFINGGTRCNSCWKDKQKELGNLYGYYPERKDETDFLYVLNFNDNFIKVGRSFDVNERVKNLKKPSESGIRNIKKLRIFTATHQEIYDYEQELHNELRERNFQHYVDWSTECFENDCQYVLNKLLDNCELEEVSI